MFHHCLSVNGVFKSALLVTLVMTLTACNSSESGLVPVSQAMGAPITFPAESTPESSSLSTELLATVPDRVELTEPDNPFLLDVPLINAGAELTDNAALLSGNPTVDGFSIIDSCRYRDTATAAGNGKWHFELEPGCIMTQRTSTSVTADQAVTLLFQTHSSASVDTRIEATIFSLAADGSERILVSKQVDLPRHANDWQTHQLTTGFDQQGKGHEGQAIGIRFRNPSDNGAVSLDALSLQVHDLPADGDLLFMDTWNWQCDQLWAGQEFWSNRLHDWHVRNQRLETRDPSRYRPQRTTHRVTTELTSAPADFAIAVRTGIVRDAGLNAFSGLLIGAGQGLDYRAAALVHNRHGRNAGLIIGIDSDGRVFIHDNGIANRRLANSEASAASTDIGAQLQLRARHQADGRYLLNAFAIDGAGQIMASTSTTVQPSRLLGSIALIANPGDNNTAHWFDDWQGFGPKLRSLPNRRFGPVLFASYTLSQGTLSMNAQYPPICDAVSATPVLQIGIDGQWVEAARAEIDPLAYTARFQVDDWDASRRYPYRIVTSGTMDGADTPEAVAAPVEADVTGALSASSVLSANSADSDNNDYFGVIQADPVTQDEVVIGVFNCRPGVILSETEGWIQQNNEQAFTWTRERIVVPHEELVTNSARHQPDLLAFLGDQLYEFDPNGFIDKSPDNLISDYLWKWFQFGWSVRDLMRNTPAFIIPDDHDVYQANVWGQGGIATSDANLGGYVHAAEFVDVVQKTQTGSLPPPYDPTPVAQGIGVYYTNLVYGGIGMAVLEDRKFKTGASSSQIPRQLLGERQHEFLDTWARNWRGQHMKMAFSQSPLSQSTTHSGAHFSRILTDRDSNGWPREGRDAAVRALQRASAPHIAGDQHLGMLLKHGVDTADDAVYSFAGPSMLNIFPRIWDPLNDADGPGSAATPYTGTYTDAHGNLITVLAAANPAVYYHPVDTQAHARKDDLGIGYGIVRVNRAERTFRFEAWPANRDPLAGALPYEGWPYTVAQADNDGRIPTGYLSARQAPIDDPLVVVEDERDGSLVYARRSLTATVSLPIFDNDAAYRVTLSDPEGQFQQVWSNQRVTP